MRKIEIRKWLWRVALVVGALGLFAGIAVFFFPLQLNEYSNRFEFWREGVHEIHSAGLHGYQVDRCDQAVRPSKECACVVMVHGLADNALTWKKVLLWPSNGWLHPVKLFSFDLPGSGLSPVPRNPGEDYRVRNQASALRQAMAPLCNKWVVVGNSLGGWVASWLALDWPEGVSKLILADSAGLRGFQKGDELKPFLDPTIESLKDFQRRAYYRGRPLPDYVWRAAAQHMKESNAREVITAQTADDYLDARLTTLRRPTLLLWGKADQITPSEEGMVFKSLVPGSIWIEVPECGHLPQKECPLEVIKAIGNMVDFGTV